MSSKKRKERRALKNHNKADEGTEKNSPLDIEKKKKSVFVHAQEQKKIEMVKDVLARTDGAFSHEERKLLDLYLFQDKSAEETMRQLLGSEKKRISPTEFYRLVEIVQKKMRVYISNFMF